jgi:hypothetical protein
MRFYPQSKEKVRGRGKRQRGHFAGKLSISQSLEGRIVNALSSFV